MLRSINNRYHFMLLLAVLGLLAVACQPVADPGGKIAFETYRDGNAEVYLMNADGSDLVNLTNNAAYDGTPSWSPDGEQIAFTSERDGNPEIFVMTVDGDNPTMLTEGEGFNVVPAWSPDGTQILFISNRTYNETQEGGYIEIPGNSKIWTMNPDGSDITRRTSRLGLDMFASWSPDAESIVFMSIRDDNPEIYIQRADRFEINLTNNPSYDTNPAWSPNGEQVAFMTDRDGNLEIYILDLETEALTNITQSPSNEGDPAWSPDGSQIAFTSDRDGNIEIYVMNADGSNPQRLTNDPADDFHPEWRP